MNRCGSKGPNSNALSSRPNVVNRAIRLMSGTLVKRFVPRSSVVKRPRPLISSGTAPPKRLLSNASVRSIVRLPHDAGMPPVMLFAPRSSVCKPVTSAVVRAMPFTALDVPPSVLPHDAGRLPVRRFRRRRNTVSERIAHNSAGTESDNSLPLASNTDNRSNSSKHNGTAPYIRLLLTFARSRLVKQHSTPLKLSRSALLLTSKSRKRTSPHKSLRLPVSLFLLRFNVSKSVSFPILRGTVPVSPLFDKSNTLRPLSCASAESTAGALSVPRTLLFPSVSSVTRPFSTVTPCHESTKPRPQLVLSVQPAPPKSVYNLSNANES